MWALSIAVARGAPIGAQGRPQGAALLPAAPVAGAATCAALLRFRSRRPLEGMGTSRLSSAEKMYLETLSLNDFQYENETKQRYTYHRSFANENERR